MADFLGEEDLFDCLINCDWTSNFGDLKDAKKARENLYSCYCKRYEQALSAVRGFDKLLLMGLSKKLEGKYRREREEAFERVELYINTLMELFDDAIERDSKRFEL